MIILSEYDHIIWDWNGTLLNDVQLCASIMNKLLVRESLPEISVEQYRNIFTFPVVEYYKLAGHSFKNNSFEELGRQFMEEYETRKVECNLFPPVNQILNHLKSNRKKQYLLSAYKQNLLDETIKHFNLADYFTSVIGLDNIYATSKVHLGKQLISSIRTNGDEVKVLLIGDTEHDLEVARSIGVDCVLISAGHQSKERLSGLSGVEILDNLDELINSINGEYS